MESHEVCKLFPEMTSEEFKALCDDIAKRGQLDPIITHDTRIIDGRHRYRACCLLSLAPKFEPWAGQGGSLLAFVVSRNLHRRNLTTSQRGMVATTVKKLLEADGLERQREGGKKAGRSRPNGKVLTNSAKPISECDPEPEPAPLDATQQAADMMNVGRTTVTEAAAIKEADPDLADKVMAGEITIHAAKEQIKRTKAAINAIAPPKPRKARQPKTTKADDHSDNITNLAFNPGDPRGNARDHFRYFNRDYWLEYIDQMSKLMI